MVGKITITKNGPYLISEGIPLIREIAQVGKSDCPEDWVKGKKCPQQKNYALCRCGKSSNKPFCDGSHAKIKFDGTETANTKKYLDCASKIIGPTLDLTDDDSLCSSGRFCHIGEGTWTCVQKSDNQKMKENAIRGACNCPSGRLVVWDKKGKAIEPKFKPAISLTEDPQAGVSGPIWVKGGIQIESESGKKYEIRNRVALCRCGKSSNRPFCDGSHIPANFQESQ